MTETFKCRYCKHSHEYTKLAGTLTNQREIETALANIETYETKYAQLYLREGLTEERKKYKEQKGTQKVKDNGQIIKDNGNMLVCSFCGAKAKAAANVDRQDVNVPFTCDNCENERTGKKGGLHIENKQHRGIDPRRGSEVCQACYYDEVVPADLVCPRTSEGRSDGDITIPKYDCLCPPPTKSQFLTIDGETVQEIIKAPKAETEFGGRKIG